MSSILYSVNDGVAKITFNRPEKFNAFNREMALAFQSRLDEAGQDEMVRAIYITGAGKAFSAGQDLSEVIDPEGPGMDKILAEHYNPIVTRIREINKPVIAAVNGVAAGAGANIALCCDITVASTSSSFLQAFSKIGLIPDSSGTYFLPRLVGFQKATAFMMLGEKIMANDAERCGMIYKVFNDESFAEGSLGIATTLAKFPTMALGFTKQLLNSSLSNSLPDQLQMEDTFQKKAADTIDFKEGVNAFMEKRMANFIGK